jgi:hypothetical protein
MCSHMILQSAGLRETFITPGNCTGVGTFTRMDSGVNNQHCCVSKTTTTGAAHVWSLSGGYYSFFTYDTRLRWYRRCIGMMSFNVKLKMSSRTACSTAVLAKYSIVFNIGRHRLRSMTTTALLPLTMVLPPRSLASWLCRTNAARLLSDLLHQTTLFIKITTPLLLVL